MNEQANYGDAFNDMPEGYERSSLQYLEKDGREILPSSDYEFAQFRFYDGNDLLWLEGGKVRIIEEELDSRIYLVSITNSKSVKVNGWRYHTSLFIGTKGLLSIRTLDGRDYGGEAMAIDPEGGRGFWFSLDKRVYCTECDAIPESRSMPDGIELWCPVCNVNSVMSRRAKTYDHQILRNCLKSVLLQYGLGSELASDIDNILDDLIKQVEQCED